MALSVPIWIALWSARDEILVGTRAGAGDRGARRAEYLRYKQWALLPMLGCRACVSLLAGMERPFLALVVSLSGLAVNALAELRAESSANCRAPGHGSTAQAIATTLTASFMFVNAT